VSALTPSSAAAFDCRITDVDESLARPILPVIDPVYCAPDDSTCELAVGAKRPLYAYNQPTNVVWEGNDARPGYHASWSFPIDGAQTDIFDLAAAPSTTTSEAPIVSSTTRSAATTSSHARPRTSTEAVPTVLYAVTLPHRCCTLSDPALRHSQDDFLDDAVPQ